MEEKTLRDYLDVPITELAEVMNKTKENAFGSDIVSIREASGDDDSLYGHISVAVTRDLLPVLNPGKIKVNGVVLPVEKKMVSKRLVKAWKGKQMRKLALFMEWQNMLKENNIEVL